MILKLFYIKNRAEFEVNWIIVTFGTFDFEGFSYLLILFQQNIFSIKHKHRGIKLLRADNTRKM